MPIRPNAEPVYRTIYVVIATLLGGGFAGGILMALNVQRTRPGASARALLWGLGGLGVALAGGAVGHLVDLPYGALPVLTAALLAVVHQVALASDVAGAREQGAPDGSAVGLGTVCLLGGAQSLAWAAMLSRL